MNKWRENIIITSAGALVLAVATGLVIIVASTFGCGRADVNRLAENNITTEDTGSNRFEFVQGLSACKLCDAIMIVVRDRETGKLYFVGHCFVKYVGK